MVFIQLQRGTTDTAIVEARVAEVENSMSSNRKASPRNKKSKLRDTEC